MKPIVAIVGRPNVGKSALFNRLLGRRRAIVHDEPGVTRDRIAASVNWDDRELMLVDTGGLVEFPKGELGNSIHGQVQTAIHDANLLLLVLDGRKGLTVTDEQWVEKLRLSGKSMIPVINKIDPGIVEEATNEFHRLGLGPLLEVSAEHNLGIETLRSEILQHLQANFSDEKMDAEQKPIEVAFVGRPNVGKSSLINAILNEPRLVVSEEPGTTRDTIDTLVKFKETSYLLLDTAGLRRRSKVSQSVEFFSNVYVLKAIEQASVTVLVIDATAGITTQDQRIASLIIERGCGLLIAANKWDLCMDSESARQNFREDAYANAPFLKFAALRFISAKTGLGVNRVLPDMKKIQQNLEKRFTTEQMASTFKKISMELHLPGGGRALRLLGLVQATERRATFHMWCNNPRMVRPELERYWEHRLIDELRLEGVPLRVIFRRKKGARAKGRPQTTARRNRALSRRGRR